MVIGGCVSIRTTGADTVTDVVAETQYNAVYGERMSTVRADQVAFAASGSNPGVCNAGGRKQGCYDADVMVLKDLQAMLDALGATPVPPRYVAADARLREAITEDIRALGLRNKAIAENDQAAWTEHKTVLEHGLALFQEAYQAFPADNRPQPEP